MPKQPRRASARDVDRFYVALTTLLRNYQFRDRDRQTVCGISVTQCYALDFIIRAKRLTVSEVGERMALNKSNGSRLVETLESLGLIERAPDPRNHRTRLVAATPSGRRLHSQIMRQLKADYGRILAPYSADFIQAVVGLLETVAQRARPASTTSCQ